MHQEVSDVEDADARVVLSAHQANVVFEAVQSRGRDGVAVEVVPKLVFRQPSSPEGSKGLGTGPGQDSLQGPNWTHVQQD